jgi:hypothetical protein
MLCGAVLMLCGGGGASAVCAALSSGETQKRWEQLGRAFAGAL